MDFLIPFIIYVCANIFPGTDGINYFAMDDEMFFAMPYASQKMVLTNPDTLLLDAAIFHASNQIRKKHQLPPFQYDFTLYLSSSRHATSMVLHHYFNHNNPYSPYERTAERRVNLYTKRFRRVAENIGQYQTIMSGTWLVRRWNKVEMRYEYLNEENYEVCQPYTYCDYARFALSQWMASPHHRDNLLNPDYTFLGCAARLSPEPYLNRKPPFANLVQNFAGEK